MQPKCNVNSNRSHQNIQPRRMQLQMLAHWVTYEVLHYKFLPSPHQLTPVMEHRETESLSLCVCTQVSLKAKRINGRNERFDCVEGRAWDGCVLGHMTSSPCQHSVDGGHTISWSLHLHKIVGLHQTRSGLQCVCVCVRACVGGGLICKLIE